MTNPKFAPPPRKIQSPVQMEQCANTLSNTLLHVEAAFYTQVIAGKKKKNFINLISLSSDQLRHGHVSNVSMFKTFWLIYYFPLAI